MDHIPFIVEKRTAIEIDFAWQKKNVAFFIRVPPTQYTYLRKIYMSNTCFYVKDME